MIEFTNVTHKYPSGHIALDDFTTRINNGEFVFLVGKSGAGKSTLLKMLIREITPQKGSIMVDDRNIVRFRRRKVPILRRNFGFVFQDYRLLPNKTVFENVAFAAEVLGTSTKEIKRRVPEILTQVGLEGKENRFPRELSGGEAQRVAIARAIINNPTYLLADEPTGNLDPKMKQEIMDLFLKINLTGTTIIVATHEKEIVNSMQKRVQGDYDDDFSII